MQAVERALEVAVGYAWGFSLIALLIGGGLVLSLWSRFLPFTMLGHAIGLLRGTEESSAAEGEISHFKALATALSSTIGIGNIGGVAIAIVQGGPGAVFWMWLAAIVGMTTKFFSCTLAVMYRKRNDRGVLEGGPMYYIEVGLGRRFRFLAVLFSAFGMVGCLALFQANQMSEILKAGMDVNPWITGLATLMLVAMVVLGGLERIATVASRLVPLMCLIYLTLACFVLVKNASAVPGIFTSIFHDAFSGTAASGGFAGIAFKTVLQTGIKRAAFSNEAGIGTAPMAHGAAKTAEPVREGLVAMLGPFIDTIVICTLTALVILTTSDWKGPEMQGVQLTMLAFESTMGSMGKSAILLVVVMFGVTTMFGYSYYGKKCFRYLFGTKHDIIYDLFYLAGLLFGAVVSAEIVVNLIDTSFALMAYPNMLATLLLAPKVLGELKSYRQRRMTKGR